MDRVSYEDAETTQKIKVRHKVVIAFYFKPEAGFVSITSSIHPLSKLRAKTFDSRHSRDIAIPRLN